MVNTISPETLQTGPRKYSTRNGWLVCVPQSADFEQAAQEHYKRYFMAGPIVYACGIAERLQEVVHDLRDCPVEVLRKGLLQEGEDILKMMKFDLKSSISSYRNN